MDQLTDVHKLRVEHPATTGRHCQSCDDWAERYTLLEAELNDTRLDNDRLRQRIKSLLLCGFKST